MNTKKKKLFATLALVLGLTTLSGCMANAASRPINNTAKSETKNSEIAKETKKSDGQISAHWAEIKKSWNEELDDTIYPFKVEHLTPKGMETWKTVRDAMNELLPSSKWKYINDQHFIGNYKTEFDSNIEAGDIVIAKENAEVLSHYAKDVTPKKDIYGYLVYLNKDNKLVCIKISIVPCRVKDDRYDNSNFIINNNAGYLNMTLKESFKASSFLGQNCEYYTGE